MNDQGFLNALLIMISFESPIFDCKQGLTV